MGVNMTQAVRMAVGTLIAAALAGCGQTGSPANQPSQSPSGATSAKPQAAPSGGAQAWDQVVAAAKKEGKVVIVGQGGPAAEALTQGFKQKFPDIQIDYTGASGSEVSAKLNTARAAGQYTVDAIVHGTTTILADLVPSGAIDPVAPFLVGPDDSDPSKWRGGKYDFADEAGKYNLIYAAGVHIPLVFNTASGAEAAKFTSWKDVLDPKWAGKLAMLDPTVAGSGLAAATCWYTTPSLGKDVMTQLLAQGVVITKDDRQLLDWVARGQYAMSVSGGDYTAVDLKAKGVGIDFVPAEKLKELSYASASFSSVAVMNRAPHPNATKVYLNWLLSKEGQEQAIQANRYPSLRTDASTAGLSDYVIPKPGVEYEENSKEQYVRIKDEVIPFVKGLIAS